MADDTSHTDTSSTGKLYNLSDFNPAIVIAEMHQIEVGNDFIFCVNLTRAQFMYRLDELAYLKDDEGTEWVPEGIAVVVALDEAFIVFDYARYDKQPYYVDAPFTLPEEMQAIVARESPF